MSTFDLAPLATALADHYNLFDTVLSPVRGGQNTINLSATTPTGTGCSSRPTRPGPI